MKICTCRWRSAHAKEVEMVYLLGRRQEKCNGHHKSFVKTPITLKRRGYLYILWYKMEAVSPLNKWLVSGCEQKLFKLYFPWTRERIAKSNHMGLKDRLLGGSGKFVTRPSFLWPVLTKLYILQDEILCTISFRSMISYFLWSLCRFFFKCSFKWLHEEGRRMFPGTIVLYVASHNSFIARPSLIIIK